MTKAAALHQFFSSFGLPVYEENTVPDDAEYPYLTYAVVTDGWGDTQCASHCSLWYRTDSWVKINAKTEEIQRRLGIGGVVVSCDGGALWVLAGSPFAQSMTDPDDSSVKRKYINVVFEYWTA